MNSDAAENGKGGILATSCKMLLNNQNTCCYSIDIVTSYFLINWFDFSRYVPAKRFAYHICPVSM